VGLYTSILKLTVRLYTSTLDLSVEVYRHAALVLQGTLGEGEGGEVPRREEGGSQEPPQIPAFRPYGIFAERPMAMVGLRETRPLRANAKSRLGRFAGDGESWAAGTRIGMVRDDPSESAG